MALQGATVVESPMFRNQYIISANRIYNIPETFAENRFETLFVYTEDNLEYSSATRNDNQVAIIGFAVDPLNPSLANHELATKLATAGDSFISLVDGIAGLSGRFVVIAKSANYFVVMPDACALRRIYYTSKHSSPFLITSSPMLYLHATMETPRISTPKQMFIDHPLYKSESIESAWFGEDGVDDRLSKVFPNHYLDVIRGTTERIPGVNVDVARIGAEVLHYAADILRGSILAMCNRYNLIQPVTAGFDSRVLLAASRPVKDKVAYYVFFREGEFHDDVRIPKELAKSLSLNFRVIRTRELEGEFLEEFSREHIVPRILPKTSDIQQHCIENYPEKTVNITGIAAEIVRNFYGYGASAPSLDMLKYFTGYYKRIPYIDKEVEAWYYPAVRFSMESKINLRDLFYWEMRVGNWAAQYPFEQDIAIDEFAPFNNRKLLLSILSVDYKQRIGPSYKFFRELVRIMWPEALLQEINPSANKWKYRVKDSQNIRYAALRLISIFR